MSAGRLSPDSAAEESRASSPQDATTLHNTVSETARTTPTRATDRSSLDTVNPPRLRFARSACEHLPRPVRRSRAGGSRSRNAHAFRPERPDCEGTSLRQLAGLPAQGCSTDRLPIRPVAGWTVALLSIDGPSPDSSGTHPSRRRARGGVGESFSPHLTSLFTRSGLRTRAPTARRRLDTRSPLRGQARCANAGIQSGS